MWKNLDKIQHPIIIKTLSKLRIEGNFPNLIKKKKIYKKSTVHTILNDEKLKDFPLRLINPLSPLLLKTIIEVLPNAIRQEKDWEGSNKTVFVHRHDCLYRKFERIDKKLEKAKIP